MQKALTKVLQATHVQYLRPKVKRLPLVLTYHPQTVKLKNIFIKNLHILKGDSLTKKIFSKPPMLAYRRDLSIGDVLTSTKIRTSSSYIQGTYPCNHALCGTCKHVSTDKIIFTRGFHHEIRSHFTCKSTCLIYCISCSVCDIKYIGETSRQLNARIGEHLRNVKNKSHLKPQNSINEDAGVAKHFNLVGHTIDNFKVQCIKHASFKVDDRRREEKRFIYLLNTITPHGLNKKFGFA